MKTALTVEQLPYSAALLITILLPFDFFLGPSILLLFIAILIAQPFKQTVQNLQNNKLFILFSGSYLIYVAAMIWTENQSFGKRDLEYKLSILFLPILIAALTRLNRSAFELLIKAFIASFIIAAIVSFFVSYANNSFQHIPTYIELSIFMHPTYFSVYLNLAFIFLIKYIGFQSKSSKQQLLIFCLSAFLIAFNLLLNSKIGIILNLLLILIFIIQGLHRFSKKSALLFISLFVIALALIFTQVDAVKSRFQSIGSTLSAENIPKDSDESSRLRILIWHQVFEILEDQPLLGVGTGDTKDELVKSYKKNGITYAYKNRLNAHNQYLEWLLTFGIIGTLFWLICFIVPILLSIKHANVLYPWFCFIVLVVFLVESFLEREYGVIFFAFFNSLLFFHAPIEDEKIITE